MVCNLLGVSREKGTMSYMGYIGIIFLHSLLTSSKVRFRDWNVGDVCS